MHKDMVANVVETIIELVCNVGLNAVFHKIKDGMERKEYIESLSEYLLSQKEWNGVMSLADEYDFGGLWNYLQSYMLDTIKVAVSGTEKERKQARKDLYCEAYKAANATTKESQKIVREMISKTIIIVRSMARNKIAFEDKFIAAEIEDIVNNHIDDVIGNSNQEIIETIQTATQFSLDNIMKLKKAADYKSIETISYMFNHCVSATHPISPLYKSVPSRKYGGLLVSVPTCDEAIEKLPPRIVCTGTITMGNRHLKMITSEDIAYADRHQLPITITTTDAKKFLGEFEDPYQHEADELKGTTLVREPREFEPPKPYSLKTNDKLICGYILLGLTEILDDGVLVITNDKQVDAPIRFRILLNQKLHTVNFDLRLIDKSCRNALVFAKIVQAAKSKEVLTVYSLEREIDFIKGPFNDCTYVSGFESIDDEVDFLERACEIQSFFEIEFVLSGEIPIDVYNCIYWLSDLIRGESVELTESRFKMYITVDSHFKQQIANWENNPSNYSYVTTAEVSLLGARVELPIIRTISNAVIENLSKVQKMAELIDEGESIPVTIVSEKNLCYDRLAPKDLINSNLECFKQNS